MNAPALTPELVQNCRTVSDRADILCHLPKGGVFAEIGVALGDFSAKVLETSSPKHFIAVDIFTLHHYPEAWGGDVGRRLDGLDHLTYYRHRFDKEIKAGRMTVLQGASHAKLDELPDA